MSNLAKKTGSATSAGTMTKDPASSRRVMNGSVPQRSGGDAVAFLRGFMARPREVASVIPSSSFLESRFVRACDLAQARCVIELGPGTGGSTRALLNAMGPDASLLAVELNPAFCDHLRARVPDPRLIVAPGSAVDLAEHLAQWRLPAADVVVSGIPFSTMDPDIAHRIAAAIRSVLAPGGRFVAYQFTPSVAGYATPLLGTPQMQWEWLNIPPMRVYRWTRTVG